MKYQNPWYLGSFLIVTTIISHPADDTDTKKTITFATEYFNTAEALYKEGNQEKALALYKQALKSDPNHFPSLFNCANILFKQNKADKAIGYYHRALAINPLCEQAHCNLGACYIHLDNIDTAITHFQEAIKINPQYARAYIQLGIAYERKDDYEQALTYYQKAVPLEHDNPEVYHHIGKLNKQLGHLSDAAQAYQQALKLKPQELTLLIELGNILNMLDHNEDALKYYLQALEINPNLYTVMYNFGFTLKKLGYINEAISVYKKILEQKPNYAHAHFSLGLSYLTLGDFQHGFPEYEWRWASYNESPKKFDSPLWDGSNIAGKTILVYAEQGFGDTFQFIRYTKLLKEQGARVIFQAQNPCAQLLSHCPYLDQVIKRDEPAPASDYHIALMSLPMMFKTRLETIPAEIPYLYPDEDLVTYWLDQLAKDTNIKIGICWQGNAHYQSQALQHAVAAKSCSVTAFEPLARIPGISLYSLQKMNGTEQLADINFVIHDLGPDFDESHGRFMDSAAVIKNLDLVITIDTSIAHLAGALGVDVWVLLSHPADWRWLLERTDTPWYPTMRLFRQEKGDTWDTFMQKACMALQEHVSKQSSPSKNIPTRHLSSSTPSAISFKPIEYNLSLEEVMDQLSRENIMNPKDDDDVSLSAQTQTLERICKQYTQNIPELTSLSQLLHTINGNLAKLAQHITMREYDIFDAVYAEVAEKICQAHQVKTQIKKKIKLLVHEYEQQHED